MSLIKCRECGKKVSDQAETCPHCGAPIPPTASANKEKQAASASASGKNILVGVTIVFAIVGFGFWTQKVQQAAPPPPPSQPVVNQKAMLEGARLRFTREIEQEYARLQELVAAHDLDRAMAQLKKFQQYGQAEYKKVPAIQASITPAWEQLEAEKVKKEATRIAQYQRKQARQFKIENQFGGLSGYHQALLRKVKESMHDPDSFEHVETQYWDRGDHIVISMQFRGKNALGAVRLNTIKAKYTIDGDLIEVVEQETL